MFKSALLAIKPAKDHTHHVDVAIALAQKQRWRLTACCVLDKDFIAPCEPVPLGAGSFKEAKNTQAMADARAFADDAMQLCAAKCADAGVPCETIVCEGSTATEVARCAAADDLLIVGHGGGDDSGEASALWRLLKACPRPALVLPLQSQVSANVLLAYDGSFQAARTLASFAYSGLGHGAAIHVLTCHADGQQANTTAGAACKFLEQHGLSPVAIVETNASSPAAAILENAARTSAGLLVMGAFGKSVLHEFLLGSVTRKLLTNLTLPVFLDH